MRGLSGPLHPLDYIGSSLFDLGVGFLVLSGIFVILFYFLYRYITMSTQPREAMRAIYLYIVTFIGLVFILVGAYAIVDFVFDSIFQLEVRNPNRLWSGALTQIVVGAALLLSHWKLAFFSKK